MISREVENHTDGSGLSRAAPPVTLEVMTPLISLRHVSKTYGTGDAQVHALRDIDLDITVGEYIAILGQSGSGKSTLLHIVGLLDTPSAGQYLFSGKDVSDRSDAERAELRNTNIGFVFQQFFLIPRATVLDNVRLPMIYRGNTTAQERTERATEALEQLGLGHRLKHRPNQLSGGERQRVAIARALVNKPKILFADEPTGNLDSNNGRNIIEILRGLHGNGMTIVLVTHEERLAREALRVVQMQDGRIISTRTLPANESRMTPGDIV